MVQLDRTSKRANKRCGNKYCVYLNGDVYKDSKLVDNITDQQILEYIFSRSWRYKDHFDRTIEGQPGTFDTYLGRNKKTPSGDSASSDRCPSNKKPRKAPSRSDKYDGKSLSYAIGHMELTRLIKEKYNAG